MRRERCVMAVVLAAVLIPQLVVAQQEERGRWSLSADVFGRARSSFGIWRTLGRNFDVGIEVDFRNSKTTSDRTSADSARSFFVNQVDEISRTSIAVNPDVKVFLGSGDARPFVLLGVGLGDGTSTRVSTSDRSFRETSDTRTYSAHLGIGVDWFPVTQVSVGVRSFGSWSKTVRRTSSFSSAGTSSDSENTTRFFNTTTTSIILHVYF